MVGVSRDSQERNDQFRASLNLPFHLVGDPEGTIVQAYDVRWPILGLAQRVTYAIGKNKKVLFAFHSELNMDSHVTKACEAVIFAAPPP